MKALVWQGPREMTIEYVEQPDPKPGEVLLRVDAVGICGSELSGYLGQNSLRVPPLIMGHEFTGEVVETGDDNSTFVPGTRAVVNPMVPCGKCIMCKRALENLCMGRVLIGAARPGAFAEWVSIPEKAIFPVPEDLDPVAGSLVEPLACGLRAARLAEVQVGDVVMIFGAGIIGLMSLAMAKRAGARTLIAVDTNERRLEIAKDWGATRTFNPEKDDVVEDARTLSDGVGVDAAIDAVGVPATRHQSVVSVRPDGRVVFVGLHDDETTLAGNHIVRSEVHIKGSFCYSYEDFQDSVRLVADGLFNETVGWLDERPLEAGKESFDEQIDGPALYPKVVLRP